MNTARSLYRSTLVAAAIAIGCVGAGSVAAAHEHGWEGHDQEQDWRGEACDQEWGEGSEHGWHERDEHRWHERGSYRSYAPHGRRGYREWRPSYPGIAFYGAPPPYRGRSWGGDLSVVIRAPL